MNLQLSLDAGLVIWSFSFAWWMTRQLTLPGSRLVVLDLPNERSMHARPIPRGGGLAVVTASGVAALITGWRYGFNPGWLWPSVGLAAILLVSYLDDRHTLRNSPRFVVHCLAAAAAVYGGLALPSLLLPGLDLALPSFLLAALSGLYIVWMINMYNFMDGLDGFCGGMSVFGFGGLALLASLQGAWPFALICLLVTVAAGGFLVHNFPPATIFMGDSGSSTLGGVAAVLSLWADRHADIPLWLSLLVFSPFVVDATVTLLRRMLLRERFWEPHRSHYYQKLVGMGWSHRRTVLSEYVLMAACVVSALLALRTSALHQLLILAVWLLIYAVIITGIHRAERRRAPPA
ncbi:MAG: MraY family glycosyltransferase [Nevskiales bacterium]